VFDVSEAVRSARAWRKRRVESGQPALSGMFARAEVTYAWPRDDGTVGSDREPVALFTGEAVHAYLGDLSDAAIEAMLNELATNSARRLGRSAFMSRSQNGRGFWMPTSIAGDTWPSVLATTPRSERTVGLRLPRRRELGLHEKYCSAGATS
jgi:hypothetical protein